MSGEGKVVCVTGASGYVASWIVKLLLQHCYTVRATVRDPSVPKTEHLRALEGAKERLQLFKADLLEEGSFDSVVDGCEGVIHTASPVTISPNDPQVEVIDPAVKGTLNVLRSCAKFHSIRRIIITSSTASVLYTGTPLTPDVIVDETWFSKPDVCKELKMWYPLSKTLAEEAAWRFAKENGIDLVTILPGVSIGPLLQPNINFSVEVILELINGVQLFPSTCVVDVRDVAYAHIRALELPTAEGRYLLAERVSQASVDLEILRKLYPTLHLPDKFDNAKPEIKYQLSNERAKSLGIDFIPWEVSLKDTIECLKERGFLSF